MRPDRATIAGLGTTSVLVASAVLLLAVVSTLLAFRWSGTDFADDIANLIVGETERPVAVQEGPARVAREAAPAAGAVAETAAPGTAAATPDPAPPVAPRPARRGPPQSTVAPRARAEIPDDSRLRAGVEIGGVLTDRSPSDETLLPETPVSADLQRVTSGLGDATEGVTDGLGRTVSGLSPPLGATLIDTGRLLADLLRALGQPR